MATPSSHQVHDADDAFPVPAPGDVIAGKYRVERVVGSGGMGIVLAARHMTLGQGVAIKLLRLAPDDEHRRTEAHARFLREGQAAARLASEHVVRVQDVGMTVQGEPFMVMELLVGADLSDVLSRHGRPPIDLAVSCVHQACHAVGEAHANGIVHRDLKPSNLFLCRASDGRPHVKVLDFGISKALSSSADHALSRSLTATRTVVGSPHYMSPEQVRDAKRVDERTDIWSLGIILYELISGGPAFDADTLPGMCAAIAADTPKALSSLRTDVPAALEAVVVRCLEKDPAKRFQTVQELVQALVPFLPAAPAASATAWLGSEPLVSSFSEVQRDLQSTNRPGKHVSSGVVAATLLESPSAGAPAPVSSPPKATVTMLSSPGAGPLESPAASPSPAPGRGVTMLLGAALLALLSLGAAYALLREDSAGTETTPRAAPTEAAATPKVPTELPRAEPGSPPPGAVSASASPAAAAALQAEKAADSRPRPRPALPTRVKATPPAAPPGPSTRDIRLER